MATLTVKNVGPIRDAELEIKKHTVFIGPQGSGKSTLAKLMALGTDVQTFPSTDTRVSLEKYGISTYFSVKSVFSYHHDAYNILLKEGYNTITPVIDSGKNLVYESIMSNYINVNEEVSGKWPKKPSGFETDAILKGWHDTKALFTSILNNILTHPSSYIPAERTLISILSNSIWAITSSGVSLPDMIKNFGSYFEAARNQLLRLDIPYLKIFYSLESGADYVYILLMG